MAAFVLLRKKLDPKHYLLVSRLRAPAVAEYGNQGLSLDSI